MIQTVLLDLDDTILDFHRAEAGAITRTLKAMGLAPAEEVVRRYSEINDAQWKLLERGELTRDEVLTRRFAILYAEMGVTASPTDTKLIYERELGKGHFFMPGAQEMLHTLRQWYDLYLVSNGTVKVQRPRLQSAGIAPYFKDIFLSEEVGSYKPQKEFFDRCFEKIGEERRSSSVIVGDGLTSDILGGIHAGIHTIWYNAAGKNTNPQIKPEQIITDWAELPAALERL